MRNVEIVEAEGPLSALVAEVEGGQEVVLTRKGQPIVRMMSAKPPRMHITAEQLERGRLALEDLDKLRAEANLGPFDLAAFKAARDEGRP